MSGNNSGPGAARQAQGLKVRIVYWDGPGKWSDVNPDGYDLTLYPDLGRKVTRVEVLINPDKSMLP